jgi:hypothetical protein
MIQTQENCNKLGTDMDVWALVQNGYFKEACNKADLEYEQTKNIFLLRNKVYALLHLNRYTEVISLTEFLIKERSGESDTDFIFCGIAHWSNKDKNKAVQVWQRAENCKYTDAAGGIELQIILYYSGIKLQDKKLKTTSSKKIAKLLNSKRSVNWPAPLGKFILNALTQDELSNTISQTPTLRERQLCQRDFTLAVKELENDNNEAYVKRLGDSMNYGPSSYVEQLFYLAKGEIETMNI